MTDRDEYRPRHARPTPDGADVGFDAGADLRDAERWPLTGAHHSDHAAAGGRSFEGARPDRRAG